MTVLLADAKPPPPPSAEVPETDDPGTDRLGKPGVVAGLWALATILNIIDQVRFPDPDDPALVSSILFLPAVLILAALVAAAIAGLRQRALWLAGALLLV